TCGREGVSRALSVSLVEGSTGHPEPSNVGVISTSQSSDQLTEEVADGEARKARNLCEPQPGHGAGRGQTVRCRFPSGIDESSGDGAAVRSRSHPPVRRRSPPRLPECRAITRGSTVGGDPRRGWTPSGYADGPAGCGPQACGAP